VKTLSRLVTLAALVCVVSAARAQNCAAPTPWRTGLAHACVDEPARASAFNNNWWQMVQWLEAKVGTVGQPLALPAGSIVSAWFAAGAVNTAALADAAVTTAKLGNGAVTAAKVAGGGIPLYSLNSLCGDANAASFSATCPYLTGVCGNCAVIGVNAYRNCSGGCPTSSGSCILTPQSCTANNTLRGYLVGP
jgi:hypothetical protein